MILSYILVITDDEAEERTWFEEVRNLFWKNDEKDGSLWTPIRKTTSRIFHSISSVIYNSVQYLHREPTHFDPGRLSVQILSGIILIAVAILWLISYIRSHGNEENYDCDENYFLNYQLYRMWYLFRKYLLALIILAIVISIPWEYIRLYQYEVSRKAAVTIKVCTGIILIFLPVYKINCLKWIPDEAYVLYVTVGLKKSCNETISILVFEITKNWIDVTKSTKHLLVIF